MLHFATIAPDLGLYMGRHLDKNGAYYAKGIQHPDKEMELLEEIRRCMDPDEKHKLEKELQAAIYDAEDWLLPVWPSCCTVNKSYDVQVRLRHRRSRNRSLHCLLGSVRLLAEQVSNQL